jgi:DNA polymerase-3 subunit delta
VIHVFYGPDQFRARESLQAVRQELEKDGNLAHNTQRLDGRTLTAADLRAACHTASFFAEDRLVIVEGLMGRFGGARRRGRRGSAPARGATELEEFIGVLTALPESTTVVLLDEQPAAALLEALAGHASVRQFPVLRREELRQWAAARARSCGASFAPAALDRLVSLVDGFHLGELASEIDKLATYANGRAVGTDDVDELVSGAVQYQIWDLTDAAIEGRGERALAVLRAMDARDYPPQRLLFMLTRQYRQLLLAQALLREGLSAEQIGAELGVQGYPLRKAIDQASRYPAERLEAAYRRLLETDVSIKTGVLDVDTALELLIVDLAELARRRPTRR